MDRDFPSRLSPPTVAQGSVHAGRSEHFDLEELLGGIPDWGVDVRQLDCGPFHGKIERVQTAGAGITRISCSRLLDQRGTSPVDWRTIGFLDANCKCVNWCGREIFPTALFSFRPDGEFEAVSHPGFHVYLLTFKEEDLAIRAEAKGLGNVPFGSKCSESVVTLGLGSIQKLRAKVRRTLQGLSGPAGSDPWLLAELWDEIPDQLVTLFGGASERVPRPSVRRRDRARSLAVRYISEFGCRPITVAELCRVTGVSDWTLDLAFREHFGVPPKTYLRATRLHWVQRELKSADPATTLIADVANRWGFWHMGQFARDYRKMFGELPSQTLGRRRPWPAS